VHSKPFAALILLGAMATLLAACAGFLSGAATSTGSREEWITVNKDHSSQRYVDLEQITPGNVGALKTRCEIRLNEPGFFSSGLLMVDRTLYVTTFRATYAIDAATRELRWRNVTHVGPALNFANRGPAYLDGVIFRAKGDGRVIGLDAKTGRVVWDERHADPAKLESFVAAPIAWDGKIFIGIAQGDLGIRGRMLALDARTGKEL
jgi:alcohol dehydrogenase (cytochrome c)